MVIEAGIHARGWTRERRAGADFDVREFHDVVLGPGIRPLSEVADDVAA